MFWNHFDLIFNKSGSQLVFSALRKMMRISQKTSTDDYQAAISALNSLQSNHDVLERARQMRSQHPQTNLVDSMHFLRLSGLQLDDLDKLNVVHISGTKGKGTTCALVEAILRQHGFKTGFYSSPHLVSVRERIRINGQPLSRPAFAHYFWKLYNCLLDQQVKENVMLPAYFKFLTILAYHVFLAEQVDVAIFEVGIGGAYDCTNVIQRPVVCGVTTLDLDHVSILGDTLEQIAWQKAGIFKPGSVAVTVPQEGKALAVLDTRSKELRVPQEAFTRTMGGIDACEESQHVNITLAAQIAQLWLQRMQDKCIVPTFSRSVNTPGLTAADSRVAIPELSPFQFPQLFSQGVANLHWPGRYQILRRRLVTGKSLAFYIDGAHTPKSIEFCAKWFRERSTLESQRLMTSHCRRVARVLIFNCTADRQPEALLPFLVSCDFTAAVFCPNWVTKAVDPDSDTANFMVPQISQLDRCHTNRRAWLRSVAKQNFSDDTRAMPTMVSAVVDCVSDVLNMLSSSSNGESVGAHEDSLKTVAKSLEGADHVQVLITGSLHLVGAVLSILDPDLTCS